MMIRGIMLGHIFLYACFLTLPTNLFGQARERFILEYEQLPETNKVSVQEGRVQLNHQLFLDEDGAQLLTLGLEYASVSFEDKEVETSSSKRELVRFVPSASLMRIINDELTLIATLRAGFYGQSEDLDSGFRLEGGALISKVISETFTGGLGVARGSALGRDFIVPLFQFLYLPDENWFISGLLPVRASAFYLFSQAWEFGATFRLSGALYSIEDDRLPEIDQIGFAAGKIGLAARRLLKGTTYILTEVGTTITRRYEWIKEGSPVVALSKEPDIVSEKDLDNTAYARVAFEWRF